MFVWWRDSARGCTLMVWMKRLDPPSARDISTGPMPAAPSKRHLNCSERARKGKPTVGQQYGKGGDEQFERPCSRLLVLKNPERTSCCIRRRKETFNGGPTHPASKRAGISPLKSFPCRTRVICLHSKAPESIWATCSFAARNPLTFGTAATRMISTTSQTSKHTMPELCIHHLRNAVGGSHVNARGSKGLREKEFHKADETQMGFFKVNGTVSSDLEQNLARELKRVHDILVNLRDRATVSDQQSVNQIVRALFTDNYFWIACYEVIQSKLGAPRTSVRVLAHWCASTRGAPSYSNDRP